MRTKRRWEGPKGSKKAMARKLAWNPSKVHREFAQEYARYFLDGSITKDFWHTKLRGRGTLPTLLPRNACVLPVGSNLP
jgi:hypothetical protein